MQEITGAATAALQAYFTGERLGEAVYTAKLTAISRFFCNAATMTAEPRMSSTV